MRLFYSGCTFSGGEPEQHLKKCSIMISYLEVKTRKGKNWKRLMTIADQRKAKRAKT